MTQSVDVVAYWENSNEIKRGMKPCKLSRFENCPDGKMRMTDAADANNFFRLIQSIPSPNVPDNMHIDLTQGNIKQHIAKLAVPAVVGYFFHTMFNVTDTFFAGLVSTQALAALSLSASVFFMVLAIGIGMSEAVTSLVGNALGEKDIPKAQHIALNAIAFAVVLSLFLCVLGVLSVPYLVRALGDPSYLAEALDYMNLLCMVHSFVGAFFLMHF
jgi:Na+-driven multidrug efflux pump